jgi:hypothetical protein
MQTSYKSSREQRRPRITLGRVVDKKTGTVIIPGVKVVGTLATHHPLHGHLKKVVVVKIPAPEQGGYYLQRMKLKTAIQKGYYTVNATNPKDKAAIEKDLNDYKSKRLNHDK